jgi:hypothetical protein
VIGGCGLVSFLVVSMISFIRRLLKKERSFDAAMRQRLLRQCFNVNTHNRKMKFELTVKKSTIPNSDQGMDCM